MDKAFKALASTPRRRILNHLAGGPMTVGEIADKFDMAMPSISKHLSVLHRRGAGPPAEARPAHHLFDRCRSSRQQPLQLSDALLSRSS